MKIHPTYVDGDNDLVFVDIPHEKHKGYFYTFRINGGKPEVGLITQETYLWGDSQYYRLTRLSYIQCI